MNKMHKVGIALACALAAAPAVAQPAPPTPEQQAQTAVDRRQSAFKLLGWNMDPLAGMLRGNVPFDAALVQANATNVANLSLMIAPLFESDTSAFDLETAALDRIWGSADEFAGKATALNEAATALVEAAGAGDDGATRAAIGRMGQACGSCHDDFRAN
jgi:cytochrome c556